MSAIPALAKLRQGCELKASLGYIKPCVWGCLILVNHFFFLNDFSTHQKDRNTYFKIPGWTILKIQAYLLQCQ
jgi:hypothetical protein